MEIRGVKEIKNSGKCKYVENTNIDYDNALWTLYTVGPQVMAEISSFGET